MSDSPPTPYTFQFTLHGSNPGSVSHPQVSFGILQSTLQSYDLTLADHQATLL